MSQGSYLGYVVKELDHCSVVQNPLFIFSYILHFIWKCPSVWRKRREVQNPTCLKSSVTFPQRIYYYYCQEEDEKHVTQQYRRVKAAKQPGLHVTLD